MADDSDGLELDGEEADVRNYMQYACSPRGSDGSEEQDENSQGGPVPQGSHQSSFQNAFPDILISQDEGDDNQQSQNEHPSVQARAPRKLRDFWESNVPEDLKQFMVSPEDVFKPVCMTPKPELLKMMCAKAKCMELLPEDDQGLLYLPTYGSTMCWIAMGGTGELPASIQEVLYFFSQVANSLGNYAHYVVPTTVTDIEVDRSDPKIIPGLVSTGEGLEPRAPKRRRTNDSQRDGFVTISDILAKRALDGSGTVRKVVPGVTIHIGNTGAIFKNEDKETREIFTVVMVTVAENLAIWPYIEGKMLQRPPKHNNPKYEEMMHKVNNLRFILKKIMRYEIFHNMGLDAEDFGMPEDYGMNSDNPLGPNTVLSMFQLPYKIFQMIRTEYPNADMASLKIAGFPEMGFTADDLVSKEVERFMLKSIKAADARDAFLMVELSRYTATKDKSAFENASLSALGGWPLEVDDAGTVLSFGLPPLPLMHRLDVQELAGSASLEEFVARLGGADAALPELTRAYMSSFKRGSSALDSHPEVDHCICDKRIADPVTRLNHYYGKGVDVFLPLVVVGRHKVGHDALKNEIKSRREKGISPSIAATMYESYLGDVMQKLFDSIQAGVFRSDTVSHMLNLHSLVDFDDVCSKDENSIAAVMARKSKKIRKERRYDGMYCAWHAFLEIWEEANNTSFLLNAGNLICAIELLLSQLMFKFAGTNESWTFFFTTILVMSGYGHFQVSTPNGIFADTRKMNSTGLDYTASRAIDFWNTLYNRLLVPKNKRCHIPLNCARFTDSVLKNITNATAAGGRLLTVPPSRTNFQVMYASEMRQSMRTLCTNGPARGEEMGEMASFNSREKEDKLRELAEELKVGTAAFTVLASNEKNATEESAEIAKTLGVVCPVFPSGVPPPLPISSIEQFNDKHTNTRGGRHRPMDETLKEVMGNVLAFSQNFAGLCALTNLTAATSVEINPTTAGFYDWICHYIFQFTSTILDTFVNESFNRMKEGYKSREVVFNFWLKSILVLSKGGSKEEAPKRLLMDVSVDPFPIGSIPSAACGLMYRGVHMPSLIITKIFFKHLWNQGSNSAVPCIKWNHLDRFFGADNAPAADEPDREYVAAFDTIRNFIAACIRHNRFCPEDEGNYDLATNISCYITDNGNADLTPTDTRASMFRLLPVNAKDKEDLRELPQRVAGKIHAAFGGELCHDCHMGPEVSVVKNALVYILDRKFRPDLRGLLSPMVFCSRKHFVKLGFANHIQGMTDYTGVEAPAYAKQFLCRVGNEIRSQGVGFNVWDLLIMNSLFEGSDPLNPHPSVSHVFTNNLMAKILANAPPGCTPGDSAPLRCVDVNTCRACELVIEATQERPEHFWRPSEKAFMETGILSVAGAIGRFLPEDLLHIPGLSSLAQRYCCKDILDTPPESYRSARNLMPNRIYPFIIPSQKEIGTIQIDTALEKAVIKFYERRDFPEGPEQTSEATHGFDVWENCIHEDKILLTPLITRLGAAALVDGPNGKIIGCLIPQPDSKSLFDHEKFTYKALINQAMDVVDVYFENILRTDLLPVGEIMYLKMDVLDDQNFREQGEGGKLLYTRLTVPNIRSPEAGKLYVNCLYNQRGYRAGGAAAETLLTLAVNPWDVQLASSYTGDDGQIVKFLV